MSEPVIIHTLWDEVMSALREGTPPERKDFLDHLAKQITGKERLTT
jgi:hypothetical protein